MIYFLQTNMLTKLSGHQVTLLQTMISNILGRNLKLKQHYNSKYNLQFHKMYMYRYILHLHSSKIVSLLDEHDHEK